MITAILYILFIARRSRMYNINDDIDYIMIEEEELSRIVEDIAARIDNDFPDPEKKLLLLCILKGSVVFMGDLMKNGRNRLHESFIISQRHIVFRHGKYCARPCEKRHLIA